MRQTIIDLKSCGKNMAQNFNLEDGKSYTYIFVNTLPCSENAKADIHFNLGKESKLYVWNLVFGGSSFSLNQKVRFTGEDGYSENNTVYFGQDSQRFEIFVDYIHEAPGCASRIFSRGILKDKAFARYDGIIRILQTASRTDTSLEEKTLLLSADAKSEAVPALEIGTNDVKAAHSASCTRVDDEQMFYAASRGIPKIDATRLIAEGFLKNLLVKLPVKQLQKKSLEIINGRLSKTIHHA